MKEKKYENERGMIPLERYYQPEIETASREQIKAWQDERLVKQVQHVWDNVPYYRKKMEEKGVTPADIKSSDDLYKLPFLTKSDLRDAYPYGLVGMPLKDCVRIQSTSGTTGKRVVAFYTQHDIDPWEDCCARAIVAAGGTNEDVCQVSYGYGLFTGGPGLNGGSHKVGCLTIPTSSGNTERQIMFIMDLSATILCCTPSYAAYIGETMKEMGLTPDQIPLKAGIFGAEPWTEDMRRRIEEKMGIDALNVYGLSEVMGPGVAMECMAKNGMHIWEDHFLPEVIGPDGQSLPYGEQGDLTFTTLTKHGMPLIRYRTHDLCTLTDEPCPCGRTHVRMGRVMGRTDDMLIIRGVNVFPSQIEHALLQVPGIEPHYHIVVDRVGTLDTIEVQVELSPSVMSDTVRDLETLERKIVNSLASHALIHASVKLCQPGTLPRSEGKAVRVTDRRHLQ